ncbi:MAG: hypothetical protein HKN26_14960 [Acidimicrobiales bacterium]|nr:hypothetical protein [Acidimicrobiales bacterium]
MTTRRHDGEGERRTSRFATLAVILALLAGACGSDTAAPTTTRGPTSTRPVEVTTPPTPPSTTGGPIETAPRITMAPTTTSDGPVIVIGPPEPPTSVPFHIDENGFNDHSVPNLASADEYFAMARSGVTDHQVVKFIVPDLLGDEPVHWLDSNFYSLHDEWYWFRLLNGQQIPASDAEPHDGPPFATIADVYEWAGRLDPDDLPLDLRWVDGRTSGRRLYDPGIYELGLDADERNYGLGAVIHVPANVVTPTDRWLIELEYGDDPSPAEVVRFFERLADTLPAAIADTLEWVIRSPHQGATADAMIADGHPYADRIVRFDELVPPGEIAVYNEGIAAGRLLYVDEVNTHLSDARDTDIILTEHVPDYLPPGSALITANPQTPLAHVNLLARNRGIPNASQSGVLDDPGIRQAARVRAYAIVHATATGELSVILISRQEYRNWLDRQRPVPISVPAVNRDDLPLIVDLTETAPTVNTDADLDRWRPIIGGKSAGFLTLLSTPGVPTPESPLAISVAPYLDHLDQVAEELDAMLGNDDFTSSARARYLLLEGPEDFADFYGEPDDAVWAEDFITAHRPGSPIGDILAADGFKNLFRDTPVDPSTMRSILEALDDTYGDYVATQGLRFRSSSSVEDIEGFNGAGLYDSNTGFFRPETQEIENDRKKSIERAILKTWASYWGFEAYEERRREKVDHRSGAMGVLVHARFDDPLEQNNGVATLTLLPPNADAVAQAEVNVQLGDVSVTNPDPTDLELPEATTVILEADGTLRIERRSTSTLSPDAEIMADDAVAELFEHLLATAEVWRDQVNASLPVAQRITTVTLDFEFKTMAAGWPARDGTSPEPARLIVKQVRSLDPGLRDIPANVTALDIPRDILARARIVERVVCVGPGDPHEVQVSVLTDPALAPDIGHNTTPWLLHPERGDVDARPGCARQAVYVTADQLLYQLLADGQILNLTP